MDTKEYVPNLLNFKMNFRVLGVSSLLGLFGLVDEMFFIKVPGGKMPFLGIFGLMVLLMAALSLANRKKLNNRIFVDAHGISELTYRSKKTLAWNELTLVRESIRQMDLFGKSRDAHIRILNIDYPDPELRETISDRFSGILSPDLPVEVRTQTAGFFPGVIVIFCIFACPAFLFRQMYQKITILIAACFMAARLVVERLNKKKIIRVTLEKDSMTFHTRIASTRLGLHEVESVKLLSRKAAGGKYFPAGVVVRTKDGREFRPGTGVYGSVYLRALLLNVLRAHADRAGFTVPSPPAPRPEISPHAGPAPPSSGNGAAANGR